MIFSAFRGFFGRVLRPDSRLVRGSKSRRFQMSENLRAQPADEPKRTPLDIAVGIFCMAFQIISAAAFGHSYSIVVQHFESKIVVPTSPRDAAKNLGHTFRSLWVMMVIVSLALAICEIVVMAKPKAMKHFRNYIVRGVIYSVKGMAVLGCAGNIGIAVGTFEMVSGVLLFVMEGMNSRK